MFRWKTLKNEMNGPRIETWEGANCGFKDQLQPETAFIFRRDLAKADLFKETVTVSCIPLNLYHNILFTLKRQMSHEI